MLMSTVPPADSTGAPPVSPVRQQPAPSGNGSAPPAPGDLSPDQPSRIPAHRLRRLLPYVVGALACGLAIRAGVRWYSAGSSRSFRGHRIGKRAARGGRDRHRYEVLGASRRAARERGDLRTRRPTPCPNGHARLGRGTPDRAGQSAPGGQLDRRDAGGHAAAAVRKSISPRRNSTDIERSYKRITIRARTWTSDSRAMMARSRRSAP